MKILIREEEESKILDGYLILSWQYKSLGNIAGSYSRIAKARTALTRPAPNAVTRLSVEAPLLEVVLAALAPEVVEDPDPVVAADGGAVMVIMLVTTLPELSVMVSAVTAIVPVGVDVSVLRSAVVGLGLTASTWPKVGSLTSPSTSHQLPAVDLGQARVETLSGS